MQAALLAGRKDWCGGLSFYFYDLETSSGSPRDGRIMQFAGQRTDENLKPIGEPDNILIKLADDVLPEPDAILVHRVTPQKTLEEGITEAEFISFFQEKVATPGTVFVGYNNIRFDDEFMRRICYRTFYDPYQWHWKDSRSRWDMLDPIRMMRALRPDGMKWPMLEGKPSVKLELMAKENGLLHENAHDALSDVLALIALAQKYNSAQPKLFSYLVDMRDKKQVAQLALNGEPFVYTSGKFSSDYEKTTVVHTLFKHPRRDGAIVYNLRHDPKEWLNKSPEELVKHWTVRWGDDLMPLPIKTMQFNKCPAVAPTSVLDEETKLRIKLDTAAINTHLEILQENPEFIDSVKKALDIIENEQQARLPLDEGVDYQLYDGFWGDGDQGELLKVRQSAPDELTSITGDIKNKRIRAMIPLYKARNYPNKLTPEEREQWEAHRRKVLLAGGVNSKIAKFSKRMAELPKSRKLTAEDEYLLTELQLYAESIIPEPEQPEFSE